MRTKPSWFPRRSLYRPTGPVPSLSSAVISCGVDLPDMHSIRPIACQEYARVTGRGRLQRRSARNPEVGSTCAMDNDFGTFEPWLLDRSINGVVLPMTQPIPCERKNSQPIVTVR